MRSVVIRFPGSNRDRDVGCSLRHVTGYDPTYIFHTETDLPRADLIILPGGFSYGDYLRCGAIGARSPIMDSVRSAARAGVFVLGICNGFQILTECGLLPGVLMPNDDVRFVCKYVSVRVENNETPFTHLYSAGAHVSFPVAHGEGNYFADEDALSRLEDRNGVIFRYCSGSNPNGSVHDICGIIDESGRILGLMPHPENVVEDVHMNQDGALFFESIFRNFA